MPLCHNRMTHQEPCLQMPDATPMSRELEFPEDRVVGVIYIRPVTDEPPNVTEFGAITSWNGLAPATGRVAVPGAMAVKLRVNRSAAQDLAFLRHLQPNDLQELDLRFTSLPDEQLAYLSELVG